MIKDNSSNKIWKISIYDILVSYPKWTCFKKSHLYSMLFTMTGSNRRQNTMFRKIFYKFCSILTYQARLFITKILLHPSPINEFRNTIWKQSIISSNKIHCRQILCNLFFQLAKIYIYIKKNLFLVSNFMVNMVNSKSIPYLFIFLLPTFFYEHWLSECIFPIICIFWL